MTTSEFTLWLKGFVDIRQAPPTPTEWAVINAKLESCFIKVLSPDVLATTTYC